jgi:hypothetical protein
MFGSMSEVTPQVLKQDFCVEKFKFQAVMISKGLDGCDGILGLSPKDYGTHSFLPELRKQGHIDRMIIAFSNAFHESTYKYKFHPDAHSYVIFGGYNET